MNDKTFHLTSLGCAKNDVDSLSMAQLLQRDGYRSVPTPQEADVLIVNTCGFIAPAREESYSELQSLAEAKLPGQLLIATGCLTQRYGEEVARRIPGVDGILGTRRWMDVVEIVHSLRKTPHPQSLYHLPETSIIGPDPILADGSPSTMRVAIMGSSAYLKIADGCRRPCAFCAIPLIKGTLVSRPMDAILNEARILAARGVKEINLIAQDTTDYGHDIGMKDGLSILLKRMTEETPSSTGLEWIRILYAFPGYVTDKLIEVMASRSQILPYLDIPLQHAHPATLQRMQRPANMEWVYKTIEKMRQSIPTLAIRTTFIVGYPGETEAEFQALLDFVQVMRFDRVGTFQFSYEEGTASTSLGDPIPAEMKEERYNRLMELQQSISLQINQSYVGKIMDVLIEKKEKGQWIGRSYRDAPEIDGNVIVTGKVAIGKIVPVRITGALAYDLEGVPVQPVTGD